jgi:hypothetical protein
LLIMFIVVFLVAWVDFFRDVLLSDGGLLFLCVEIPAA